MREQLYKLRLDAFYLANQSGNAETYNTLIEIHDRICDIIDNVRLEYKRLEYEDK